MTGNDVLLAAGGGSTKLILPDVAELVWGAVSFIVVFIVLTKIAFPRLREAVESREKKIQQDLEEAEKAKNEAHEHEEERKQQLAEARSEANRIIEEARQSAEQVRKDLVAKAEKEAEEIVRRGEEQIQGERERAVQELRRTVADLTIELARQVVGRELKDEQAHKELVDSYIEGVASMSGDGRAG